MLSLSEDTLNKRYDFLRRSVISYYAKCMSIEDETQKKHYPVPCGFDEIMKFVKDLFFNYIKEL